MNAKGASILTLREPNRNGTVLLGTGGEQRRRQLCRGGIERLGHGRREQHAKRGDGGTANVGHGHGGLSFQKSSDAGDESRTCHAEHGPCAGQGAKTCHERERLDVSRAVACHRDGAVVATELARLANARLSHQVAGL